MCDDVECQCDRLKSTAYEFSSLQWLMAEVEKRVVEGVGREWLKVASSEERIEKKNSGKTSHAVLAVFPLTKIPGCRQLLHW